MGKIRILALLFLTLISLPTYSQNSAPADSVRTEQTDTISLGEVQVAGAAYTHKGDHLDLYLKKYNLKFGNNALDAVSSLSQFNDNIGGTSLLNLRRQEVTILINGVPSTGQDLRTYRSGEILKVEYYEAAPPQYMNITRGPIANVIMKRPIERLYAAYITGSQSPHPVSGEYQASLTYRDSLNQVKVYAYDNFGRYRIHSNSVFSYPDGIDNIYASRDGRYHYNGLHLQGEYQYYNNRDLLHVRLVHTGGRNTDDIPSAFSFTDEGETYTGLGGEYQNATDHSTSLTLYYSRSLGKNRSFRIRVINGLGHAVSDNHIWRTDEDAPQIGYDISSQIKNNVYSLQAFPSLSLGNLRFSGQFMYQRLTQRYVEEKSTQSSMLGFLYAGYRFQREAFMFSPTAGATVTSIGSARTTYRKVHPYAELAFRTWGQEGWKKGLEAYLSVTCITGSVSPSALTQSVTARDNRFFIIGNPWLKSSWYGYGNLSLSYYRPDGLLSVQFTYNPGYHPHYQAPVIYGEGGNFYQMEADIDRQWKHSLGLYSNWRLRDWLTLSPYLTYDINRYSTPNRRVAFNTWRLGGSATLTYSNVELILAGNPPIRTWTGDIFTYMSSQFAAVFNWKWSSYSLGLEWHYVNQHDHSRISGDGFSYTHRRNLPPASTVSITASVYLAKGKARRQPNVGGNSIIDNGLRTDQSPHK